MAMAGDSADGLFEQCRRREFFFEKNSCAPEEGVAF
jgi:hypothetical protein